MANVLVHPDIHVPLLALSPVDPKPVETLTLHLDEFGSAKNQIPLPSE